MEKRIKLIYQGKRLNSKGVIRHSYRNIEKKKNDWYGSKLLNTAIGGIVEATETDTGVKQPYTFIGKHEIESDLTEWVEADWAAQKKYDLSKEMKKLPKTEYNKILERLNLIIYNLPRNQRKLFKIKLLMDLMD